MYVQFDHLINFLEIYQVFKNVSKSVTFKKYLLLFMEMIKKNFNSESFNLHTICLSNKILYFTSVHLGKLCMHVNYWEKRLHIYDPKILLKIQSFKCSFSFLSK